LGHFTSEIILNDEYLSQFLPDRKVLEMTLEQLFEIFIKFSMFDCSRATCVMLGGKINVWSHLCEEMPEEPQNG